MKLLLTLTLLFPIAITGQIPCDAEYGTHCPSSSSYAVGDCLLSLPSDVTLPTECKEYIKIMNACKADIESRCANSEFTGDAMPCLTEWTNPSFVPLSEECVDVLPVKAEVKAKREQSDDEKRKSDNRRRIRDKSAKMAREQESEKRGGGKEKKKGGNGGSKGKGGKQRVKREL